MMKEDIQQLIEGLRWFLRIIFFAFVLITILMVVTYGK